MPRIPEVVRVRDQEFHDEVHQVRQQLFNSEGLDLFNVSIQNSLNMQKGFFMKLLCPQPGACPESHAFCWKCMPIQTAH